MSAYQQLEAVFSQHAHLQHVQAITGWDEAVMMPIGGGAARAEALAALEGVMHTCLVSPKIGDWLQMAHEDSSLDPWQQANLCWMEKKYVDATLIPNDLIQAQAKASVESEQAWRVARAENDWSSFAPKLQKTFDLVKEVAGLRAAHWGCSAYDVLLNDYVPGFNQNSIDTLFDPLERELPYLLQQITASQQTQSVKPCCGPFSIDKQRQLGLEVMALLSFNFDHGRLDVSHHPFCGGVASDVRITTRFDEHDFVSALMGICHETGHGRYEQGLPKKWSHQPVGEALGMAVHESQSLFVEMHLCRSYEFIRCLVPLLVKYFGAHEAFTEENVYKLYTRVQPGLIRVDADEVSYPLHVIMRYKIEQQLFSGAVGISDLPELWNSYMQHYFNLSTLTNDKDGVMQDVHWPSGAFGYFPAYTLGRLIAAQLHHQVAQDLPNLSREMAAGQFDSVFDWLHTYIYSKASSQSSQQLMLDATGQDLSADSFLAYVKQKYVL